MRPVCNSSRRPVACAKQSTITVFAFDLEAPERLCGFGNRMQRRLQRGVQRVIAVMAEPGRLHAAAEQVEAEIEVARVLRVIAEEAHACCVQLLLGAARRRDRRTDGFAERGQRLPQHLGVDRLLGIEMEIQRRRRVAGPRRDRPQARALEAFLREHAARRVEDQLPLVAADRFLPALAHLHGPANPFLTQF
ncbi:hypothetical protein ACVI1L_004385 [Bradyrhizobium sp. USDA 4516]